MDFAALNIREPNHRNEWIHHLALLFLHQMTLIGSSEKCGYSTKEENELTYVTSIYDDDEIRRTPVGVFLNLVS